MKKQIWAWLFVSLFVGGFISLFASSHPDGFEKAGEEVHVIAGATSIMKSPLPDYSIPGVGSWLSSSLAGIIGVALTFGIVLFMGRWISRRSR